MFGAASKFRRAVSVSYWPFPDSSRSSNRPKAALFEGPQSVPINQVSRNRMGIALLNLSCELRRCGLPARSG